MDANKVWQWRIMRVKTYLIRPEPFFHSNRIGLDFNVASNTQKKLDIQLVTNGVILEVCDFAKTVNKSKRHFLTKILENNFDLGLEDEQQRIDFTARIMHKVKDLIRKPPKDKKEVFTLFDTSCKPECNGNNGLNMASTEPKTDRFLAGMDDTDDSENEDEFGGSQATSKEHIKTGSLSEKMDEVHGGDGEHEDELNCSETQSAEAQREAVLPTLYPYCEEIGLNLDVGSKQSLDPGLLTKTVMLELVHFTRILTASYSPIVLGVLEHNFDLDLKSQRAKNRVWFKISHLLKRRKRFITTGSKMSPEFKNEPFSFQTNPFKRARGSALSNMEGPQYPFKEVTKRRQSDLRSKQEKRALFTTGERANKRCRRGQSKAMEINTLAHHTDLYSSQIAEEDHCHTYPLGESDLDSDTGNKCDMEQEEIGTENNYTCPLGESDLDSDKVTDSENTGIQDHLENPKSCSLSSDIPRESEATCLGVNAPFLTSTDVLHSTSPNVNSNANPPVADQPEERGCCGAEEQTQTTSNAPNECDVEQDEMGTEKNMWKLRANRVKQILSSLNKEFGPFNKSKKFGLEFNVGFGPKQNISVASLPNSILLEVAKFALAINSSQQDFIMEILEYNFDFGVQSKHQRNIFTSEMINRVRKLRSCEGAVKISEEVSELPGPMPSIKSDIHTNTNHTVSSVNPELCSILRMEECDVAPVCPPHSHAETTEHISQKSVDLNPFCEEIGLKLHLNKQPQNQKLDTNKLTNGAMTEVTNFAEKLCGTFEQICLDILGHNFDQDLQSGDSDLARSIVAQIPTVMAQRNLATCVKAIKKVKIQRKDFSTMVKLDCQNNPHSDTCSAGSSQAAVIDRDVGSSADTEHQNELNLKLWKLRTNHSQQILSIPHEEHCPLYSYSRCKKLGINFNVGSGVKQNLNPKSLTNGIMVELNTFATALLSAQKHFITEILEYNFHLYFTNELYRSAFAQQTLKKIKGLILLNKSSVLRMKMLFELPDMRCIQQPTHNDTTTYCPKCYQARSHKLRREYSDPGHMHHPCPHTMTDTASAHANCTSPKPAKDQFSTFPAIEEMIMDSYPGCKKIGLNLFVDKDQPKDKLDTHVLSCGIMCEVAHFAKTLCGSKSKIIHAVLEHNFNLGVQRSDVNIAQLFRKAAALQGAGLAWFNEVFVIQPFSHRPPGYVGKVAREAATQRSGWRESIKNRKLALQTKEERDTLPRDNISVVKKSKRNPGSKVMVSCYPFCTEIGLDLDVASKTEEKEKLDLKLLTRAVVWEMHKFAMKKTGLYLPHTVYDILDYNFDLSSQNDRRWEFSIATTSKIQAMVRGYHKLRYGVDKVFKLPFVFASKSSQRIVEKTQNKKCKTNEGRFVRQIRYRSGVNRIHFLDGYKTEKEAWYHDDDTQIPADPGTIVQMDGKRGNVGCPFQGDVQIKEEEYDPCYGNVKPEPDTEEKYRPLHDDVKTESNAEEFEHLVPGEPTLMTVSPNSERLKTESENENVQYYVLAASQGSVVCPNMASNIKTEWETEGFEYLVPVEAAGSQEYSMVTIGQGNESTLIKEEQENEPVDSHLYGVLRK